MRTIFLSLETTGLSPHQGDRVIEIGGVEVIENRLTGLQFHQYLNPQTKLRLYLSLLVGYSNGFLEEQPEFGDIMKDFLRFVGQSDLVSANAGFDLRFLNRELTNCGMPLIDEARFHDILPALRRMLPGPRQTGTLDPQSETEKKSIGHSPNALIEATFLARLHMKGMAEAVHDPEEDEQD